MIIENNNIKELITLKHNIEKKICEKEFEEKGYKKILDDKNIKFILLRRTPLGKNDYHYKKTIGISQKQFLYCIKNHIWIIFGITYPLCVDEHDYFVYRGTEDISFMDGYTSDTQYINYILTIKDENNKEVKNSLKKIQELIEELK